MSERQKRKKYLKIEKIKGQEFLKIMNRKFKNRSVIDKRYKILKEKENLLFPLIDNEEKINLLFRLIEDKFSFKIISKIGIYDKNYKYKNLKEALEKKIPHKFLNLIPHSYDIVGKIVILEFDNIEGLEDHGFNTIKVEVAKVITEINKNVTSVFEKKSDIKGIYRIRELNLLYGENKTETIYRENKCIFKLDVNQTFFTPRLVYERNRIATSKIKKNEVIIDLFAGVGPFSIQIAKNHQVKLHAFDINPIAYNYLKENIRLNKLKGSITPHNIDIKSLLDPSIIIGSMLKNKADRIIMNLPEKSLGFMDIACFLMKNSGGILHNYQFCEKPNSIEKAKDKLKYSLEKLNWYIQEIITSKIVKSYSPKSELIVLDAKIKSLNN
ncbi:MAG: class I SAM-dependent methyltransferase family protein [Promethearchaeota archaeon]